MNPTVLVERIEVFECRKCRRDFYNKTEYLKHVMIHLTSDCFIKLKQEKIYKCEKCNRIFLSEHKYAIHKLVHVKEEVRVKEKKADILYGSTFIKRFNCDECGLKFVEQSTLIAHSVLHRPFPHNCFCGIGYYQERDLKGHITLVHPELKENIEHNNNHIRESKVIYKDDIESSDGEYSSEEEYMIKKKHKLKGKRKIRKKLKPTKDY